LDSPVTEPFGAIFQGPKSLPEYSAVNRKSETSPSEAAVLPKPVSVKQSRFAILARDVATMGFGTALTAVFNVLLVFLIPRVVTVENFGYWRLFMLYVSYVGLLQLGFLDGVLLRWAGRPLADFHAELRPAVVFLLGLVVILIVPVGAFAWWKFNFDVRFIAVAVLLYAVIYNLSALLFYGLQSARQFKPVAIATAAPTGVFVLLTFVWNAWHVPDFRILIELYCIASAGALVYLWVRVKPLKNDTQSISAWSIGESCILVGWPIVLSNIGAGLVQSADRLVASWILPIHQFAQYSLASSAMFVPVMAIAAIYRVFFSHASALEHDGRMRIYAHGARFLLLAWSLMLPYFFVLEQIVNRFLPKYVPSLPAAGILLFGVFFLAEIQILHTSFAYIYGKQRQFLMLTIAAAVATFGIGLAAAIYFGSLIAIAFGQLISLAIWWLANNLTLSNITGQNWRSRLILLATFAWSAIAYETATKVTQNVGFRILIYYLLVCFCLFWVCRSEIEILRRLVVHFNAGKRSTGEAAA
jgi:O-antigen/teichoic acid export membrane protein